jgi:hypothetical protein
LLATSFYGEGGSAPFAAPATPIKNGDEIMISRNWVRLRFVEGEEPSE